MDYQEKVQLYKRAKRIVSSDLEWEDKYDMIFSEEISKKFDFDWCDPDTSYQEDVEAFMVGFDNYMKKQKIVFEQIDCEEDD